MQQILEQYDEIESLIRNALSALNRVCDGARDRDEQGFKACHANEFTQSLIVQQYPYTEKQLMAAYNIVKQYPTQLAKFNITLPDYRSVRKNADDRAIVREKRKLDEQAGSQFTITYHHEAFWVVFEKKHFKHFEPFKEKCAELWRKNYPGYATRPEWSEDERLGWKIPRTYQIMTLFMKMFPKAHYSDDELTQKALKIIDQEKRAALLRAKEQAAQKVREQMELLSLVNTEGEIVPGVKLYEHQIENLQIAATKDLIIADKMGLGKTVSAAAIALMFSKKMKGVKVIVITKKAVRRVWLEWAERMALPMEVYTWQSMPDLGDNCEEFIAICDESHLSQNLKTQRTQNMLRLTLHPKCRKVIHCTGTPSPNGRPRELYQMLLSIKHPLVWSDNPDPDEREDEIKKLRHKFEKNYCAGEWVEKGGQRFWDNTGKAYLEELNRLLYYVPGRTDNHAWSCIIQHKKEECIDLPPKERQILEAEVDGEDKKLLAKMLEEAIEQFEKNKEINLENYRIERAEILKKNERLLIEAGQKIEKRWDQILEEEYNNKEQLTENARTLALQTAYRRASALVKVKSTVEQAKEILLQGEKVVIFTMFRESAEQIKKRLEEEAHVAVGTVWGGQKEDLTNSNVEDFQSKNGKRRVMVCTMAGGHGITLTAASYLIMNDRPWIPGDAEQCEDRIHRIGSEKVCIIYWTQIPEYICKTDVWIDNILLEKDRDITIMTTGKSGNSLKFQQQCVVMIKEDAKRNAKAAKVA